MRLHVDPRTIRKLTDDLEAEARRLMPSNRYRPMVLGPPARHVCRICGVERDGPEQIDTTALGSSFTTTVDGPYRSPCPTPRCGEVCKLCRREVGDVHGPDCGPLMVTKLERPHIVDRGDCI